MAFARKFLRVFSSVRSFSVFPIRQLNTSVPWRRFSEEHNLEKLKQEVAELEKAHGDSHVNLINPYSKLSLAYNSSEDLPNALFYYQKAMKIAEQEFEGTEEMAVDFKNLAKLYRAMGDSANALSYSEKALALELYHLGESHPKVGLSYNNIAAIKMQSGDFDGAYEILQKALPILGHNSEDKDSVRALYINLGYIYSYKQMYEESIQAYNKALEHFTYSLDSARHIAKLRYQLGLSYEMAGQLHKAAEAFDECLQTAGDKFSDEEITQIQSKRGAIFYESGDVDQAISCFKKALEFAKKIDKHHPHIRLYHRNLGKCYLAKSDWSTAELHLETNLNLAKKHSGEQSADVAEAYDLLSNMNSYARQPEKALEFAQLSLKIREALPDVPAQLLGVSLMNLGLTQHMLSNLDEAEKYLLRAKEKLEEGKSDTLLGNIHTNLGILYKDKKDIPKGIQFLERATEILKQGPPQSIDLADAYRILGTFLASNEDFEKALDAFKRAAQVTQGSIHQAKILDLLGKIYKQLQQPDLALENYQKALDMRLNQPTKDLLSIAQGYQNIAHVYKLLENFDKALEFHQKGKETFQNLYGSNHSLVGSSHMMIAEIYQQLGQNDKAKSALDEVVSISIQLYGEESDTVQKVKSLRSELDNN